MDQQANDDTQHQRAYLHARQQQLVRTIFFKRLQQLQQHYVVCDICLNEMENHFGTWMKSGYYKVKMSSDEIETAFLKWFASVTCSHCVILLLMHSNLKIDICK